MVEKLSLFSRPVSDSENDEKRSGIFINLTPEARALIKSLKSDTGMTQQAAVERVMQWFLEQPSQVRNAVLSRTGDAAGELMKIRMTELAAAGTDTRATSAIDAARARQIIKLMVDRLEQIDQAKTRELRDRGTSAKKRG